MVRIELSNAEAYCLIALADHAETATDISEATKRVFADIALKITGSANAFPTDVLDNRAAEQRSAGCGCTGNLPDADNSGTNGSAAPSGQYL